MVIRSLRRGDISANSKLHNTAPPLSMRCAGPLSSRRIHVPYINATPDQAYGFAVGIGAVCQFIDTIGST